YSSLNIAQALQLAAWELRYALLSDESALSLPETGTQARHAGNQPSSNEKIQALLEHLEEALIHINFLNPDHPKKLMQRLRYLIMRSSPSNDEVDMLRGICTAILHRTNHSHFD